MNRKNFRNDLMSGVVVFLIAIPLCLGIAIASGAPPISGLISGVIGGIFVGFFSKSGVSVCGPAAGLVAIMLSAIESTGTFESVLLGTAIAGLIQVIFGVLKAGGIAYFFPSSVIRGMLSAIGLIIFIKQVPHFLGYDQDYEGDLSFYQPIDSENTFSELINAIAYTQPGVILVGLLSLLSMVFWDRYKWGALKLFPGALISVIVGLCTNELLISMGSPLAISSDHLIQIPVIEHLSDAGSLLISPNFSGISDSAIWVVAITIALVASIETLLTIEATDKLDPLKRVTPVNRELIVQGFANFISGLTGGLPITSVIVRSSANIDSGGRTKIATITHGLLITIGILFFASLLNRIPLTSLAAILLITGWNLASPKKIVAILKSSRYRWVPFMATFVTIVFTDLLIGIGVGLFVGIIILLLKNLEVKHYTKEEHTNGNREVLIVLPQEASFLNKASLLIDLDKIREGDSLIIDASKSYYIDPDVLDIIHEFAEEKGEERDIREPLEDGPLKSEIRDYCKKVGFRLNNVFVIDGSKRSSKANAYFSGFGKTKRVTLFDTLIKTLKLASYLSDAPWPATKDELIDYAIRSGSPMEVVENLQSIVEEEEEIIYASIEQIWPDYPTKEDYLWNEDEY
ncbi:sulfate permease [Elysia marginata]|uniref:Sulfate permease n=1 Tax=Elysia marginata TaxID=1093978 RepID=A0AAV4GNU5_9GAST|nr:sulfate permease [Elysia marginata]